MFLAYSAQGLEISPIWDSNAGYAFSVVSMPDNRSEQADIMYAGTGMLSQSTGAATLTFHHAQSLLRFTGASNVAYDGSTNTGVTVTSITMSSLLYGGSFYVTQYENGTLTPTWYPSTAGAATAYSGTGNLPVSAMDLGVGYMVYPQTPVAITVNYTLHNGKDASGNNADMSMSYTFTPSGSWAAGTAYTYAISFTEGEISVSASLGAWEAATQTWFYATADAVTQKGANFNFSSTSPMWWRASSSDSYEQLVYESGSWGSSVRFETSDYYVTVTAVSSNYTVAYETKAPPKDLSIYDIWGDATLRNTANTYVVRERGTYLIPLVYGNAIKDGTTNSEAYTKKGNSYAGNFINTNSNNITSPYIESHTGCTAGSAGLLWCTAQNVISSVEIISVDGEPCRFLKFRCASIPANNAIAVVYVKNTSGTIIWSWMLWLTTDALNTVSYSGYDILDENLGSIWITRSNGNDRKMVSPYYQWGRKDPFPPLSDYNSSSKMTTYNESGVYSDFAATTNTSYLSIPNSIASPNSWFNRYNTSFYTWYGNTIYWNLWNANYTGTTTVNQLTDDQYDSIKTIYDPSPAGFKVASGYIITQLFPNNGTPTSTSYGLTTNGLWFPLTGYMSNANSYYSNTYSYVWSYSPYSTYRALVEASTSSRTYYSNCAQYYACAVRPIREKTKSLTSVTVSPGSTTYYSGGYNVNYTATATFSDGSSLDVTSQASWSVDGLATSNGNGSFTTGNSNGTTSVHATYAYKGVAMTGNASLTLRDRIVNSIGLSVYDELDETWTSSSARVELGHGQSYRLHVVWEDGESFINNGFTLSSSNSSVISTSYSSSTASSTGSANVTATFGGKTSNTIALTVVPAGEYRILINIDNAVNDDGWPWWINVNDNEYCYNIKISYYDWINTYELYGQIHIYRARYVNGNLDGTWGTGGYKEISTSCSVNCDYTNQIYGNILHCGWYDEESFWVYYTLDENLDMRNYLDDRFYLDVSTPYGDYCCYLDFYL